MYVNKQDLVLFSIFISLITVKTLPVTDDGQDKNKPNLNRP